MSPLYCLGQCCSLRAPKIGSHMDASMNAPCSMRRCPCVLSLHIKRVTSEAFTNPCIGIDPATVAESPQNLEAEVPTDAVLLKRKGQTPTAWLKEQVASFNNGTLSSERVRLSPLPEAHPSFVRILYYCSRKIVVRTSATRRLKCAVPQCWAVMLDIIYDITERFT